MQDNLARLLKEYDNLPVQSSGQSAELPEEIRRLEEENQKLNQQIKDALNSADSFTPQLNTSSFTNDNFSPSFPAVSSTLNNNNQNNSFGSNSKDFSDFFSPTSQQSTTGFGEDPFQAFDPFNTNSSVNDPFKSAPLSVNSTVPDDPFASAFDPFSQQQSNNSGIGVVASGAGDDPFSDKRKAPPPRPAPPRPQTPSLKPVKKPTDAASQRPQSALDFTRNTKLDLFNDFSGSSDPFQSKPANTANKGDLKHPLLSLI